MKKVLLFILLLFTACSLTSCNKECTITYDGNSTTITINETFTFPETKKEGYIFLGWFKDQTFTDGPYESYTPSTKEDITFYAKWIDIDTFEANKVIDLINELTDIKLTDKKKVDEAKNKYDNLTDSQQEKVTNYYMLEAALAKIEELEKDNEAAMIIREKIDTLPEVITLSVESLILEIYELYNQLTPNQKELVFNFNKLEGANKIIQDIKNDIETLINGLIEAIDSLPQELTLEHEVLINSLTDQFNLLNAKEKERITNYNKLVEAKTKLETLKQQEKDKEVALKMDEVINTLPDTITLDDEEEVLRIKALYDQLTVGQKIKVSNYSKLKKAIETIDHIKSQNEKLEKLQKIIDELPDNITIEEESKVHYANALYITLDEDYQRKVKDYGKLEKALEIIRNFDKDVVNVIKEIEKISTTLELDDKNDVLAVLVLYDKLTIDQQNLVTNYDKLKDALETLAILQEEYDRIVKVAKMFDVKIASLPSKITYLDKTAIKQLIDEYNGLDEEIKKNVKLLDKLNNAKKKIDDIESDVDSITYILGENVYNSKDELYESFFSDYYWFIYGYYGEDALTSKGVNSVDDFLKLGRTPGDQSTKYRVLADTFSYFLKKDVNGLKENQPESTFVGYCMKNNIYEEIIDFFIMFFAYWRIDEGYANTGNYGADFFAEGWAPQVDICKFFNYTEDTREVPKTKRVLDCFNSIEGVVEGHLQTEITEGMILNTNLIRRGYTFDGWYDNPNYTGEAITEVSKTDEKVILYAKWAEIEKIQDSDNASVVDIYIYNLTTSRATVNKTTIGYTRNMYNNLTENAKKMVANYNTLVSLENKYK